MKLRYLIPSGVVLVALFLLVLRTHRTESEKEKVQKKSRQLLIFDRHEVDGLTVENASGKVVCKKIGERAWKIVEPVEVDANRRAVEGVIVNLLNARVKRFISQGEEANGEALKEYGLDPPKVRVSLRVKGRVFDTVLYGNETPSGKYVYVKKASESRIGIIELYRRTGVDRNFAELRYRNALEFKWAQVRTLRIESQRASIELTKVGEEWQMKSPVETGGDREEIELLLQRLSSKTVQEFVEDAPKSVRKYGLDPPMMRIDVTVGENNVRSLWIGDEREGNYYAKDASKAPVFTLDSAFVSQMDRTVFDLRYKKLLDFKRRDVDRVEFVYPDSSVLCVRDKRTQSAWVAVPRKGPVKGYELDAILFNMEKLKAERFLTHASKDSSQYGLDPPRMRVRLWAGDHMVGDLSLGNAEGDLVYVRGSGDEIVCLVKKEITDRLTPERIFGQEHVR